MYIYISWDTRMTAVLKDQYSVEVDFKGAGRIA